jgi:hypothetical protein
MKILGEGQESDENMDQGEEDQVTVDKELIGSGIEQKKESKIAKKIDKA